MSDYSFLKSGHNLVDEPKKFNKKEQENIMIMLSLFSSNALINGAKYCELCERDGVTKEDLVYGMRYEVFEFLKRDNLMESMDEMAKDYYEEMKNISEDENIKGTWFIRTSMVSKKRVCDKLIPTSLSI